MNIFRKKNISFLNHLLLFLLWLFVNIYENGNFLPEIEYFYCILEK